MPINGDMNLLVCLWGHFWRGLTCKTLVGDPVNVSDVISELKVNKN